MGVRRLVAILVLLLLALLTPEATGLATPSAPAPAPVQAAAFPDVAATHPYATAIADLSSRGIITGFADGTFGPEQPVIRQQFAKMIVRSLDYEVSPTISCPFTDVDPTPNPNDPLYPAKYVAVCALHGVTVGKTLTTFDPYSSITGQQLITMVTRAADPPEPPPDYTPPFSSAQFTLEDHYRNAREAAYAGLLNGLQNLGPGFDFLAPATRGECAQLLHNLLLFLAGPTPPTGSLTHVWWSSPGGDWQKGWQSENVSQITGAGAVKARIGGLNSYEPVPGSPYEHVFSVSDDGELLMFRVSRGGHQWELTNITTQTGCRVASLCDGDVQQGGTTALAVLHLAARDFAGDLLHFWWQPGQDWKSENVSRQVGAKIAFRPTFFWDDSAPAGAEMTVGAAGTNGHLLLFHLLGSKTWMLEDVTLDSGVTCSGFVRWDPFGAVGLDGHLYLLERPAWTSPWQVTDVSAEIGREVALGERLVGFTFEHWAWADQYQHFALITPASDLLHVWKDGTGSWHSENISSEVGEKISSVCQSWTHSGPPRFSDRLRSHLRRHSGRRTAGPLAQSSLRPLAGVQRR